MKKSNRILWGIVLIVLGVIIAFNTLKITNIDIFFDGWWTLFIIVPSAIGLFTERDKTGNIIALLIGVFLLLACLDIVSFGLVWKLLLPAIIIIIGVKLVFGGVTGKKTAEAIKRLNSAGGDRYNATAVFSGSEVDFDGTKEFCGAELNAIFGGIDLDASRAVINSDCVINASAIFGGIDLKLPDNVNVKVQSTSLFGGVSNKKPFGSIENAPTVYINATCMFGGVDIK